MRCMLIALLVAVASAYRDWKGVDTEWATHPDRTAEWYEEYAGGRRPELAPAITTVVANKSSVVKLECVGCPFRVRELHPEPEEWQEPPQDNSLLLNFTIDASSGLLLNGRSVAPLALPLHIHAFQVPANFSKDHMEKAVNLRLMDDSWNLGTKFGTFELQYEHTVVGTREPGKSWIQFDVTGILYTPQIYAKSGNGYYLLKNEDQKIVQILLRETAEPHQISMEDVQIIDRKDRAKPYRMECGRLAMARTVFNPLEWDRYGKIGTWSRAFYMLWSKTRDAFWANFTFLPILVILVPVIVLFRWMARKQQEVAVPVEDDAEAALLGSEHEDAPPEHDDVPGCHMEDEKV
ncbi:uncharacterized protein N0V89_008979 [Didymosphaeria variabile]|uniref:Uncharacterized protein n=1 Tax=Didymosphaeria variabile TaxID=1932322 RepID=A0A9W8XH96_9PLEO|nr:uncharacterized protein N0V89_008979 [Didymosphaeria variabile]KAJ4350358.1 hypothetical protein N0V89_008979 [Didymosphaeria variabile]